MHQKLKSAGHVRLASSEEQGFYHLTLSSDTRRGRCTLTRKTKPNGCQVPQQPQNITALEKNCIVQRFPYFNVSFLEVPSTTKENLKISNFKLLEPELGYKQ